jgi:hypothetical protein
MVKYQSGCVKGPVEMTNGNRGKLSINRAEGMMDLGGEKLRADERQKP